MKRTVNRVIARLAMFLIAIVLGAIAVSQANRGMEARRNGGAATETAAVKTNVPPIPLESKLNTQAIPDLNSTASANYMREVGPQTITSADDYAAPQSAYAAPEPAHENSYVAPTGGEFQDGADEFDNDPLPIQPPVQTMRAAESAPPTLPPAEFESAPETEFVQQTYDPPAEATYDADDFGSQGASDSFADDEFDSPPPATSAMSEPPAMDPIPAPVRTTISPSTQGPPPMTMAPSQSPRAVLAPSQPDYRTASLPPSNPPEATYTPQTLLEGAGELGNGKPGPAELEGPQKPALTIVKKSPQEVQVGQPAKFHVTVRNEGQVPAHDVLIRDEVPHGTRLVQTNPPHSRAADGALLWQMGTLRPGAEVTTMMEIMPMEEGDVGSVATVSFQTSASSRSVATRPQLVLEHTAERQALVGEEVLFRIKLANNGSGAATNVTLEENVPHGLQHYDGNELEYRIGTIAPGESRMLELTLKADEAGLCKNMLVARADGNLMVEDHCEVEIVAPQIRLEFTGPRRRFLDRQANYEIHIANPGTAAAENLELVAHLPRALKFVSTNNSGNYDAQRHVVVWNLSELPAQEMGTVELKTMPTQMGKHSIQVEARANMGLSDAVEHDVTIEGLVALLYTVTDVSDPIEVGGQTTYEIHVVNQGSKTASNLRVGAMIPDGMEAINGEGPTRVSIDGPRVVFDALPRLAAQADTFYKIHVKGTQPGDKRIQVQLISDDVSEPVTKEESTHVYADQ